MSKFGGRIQAFVKSELKELSGGDILLRSGIVITVAFVIGFSFVIAVSDNPDRELPKAAVLKWLNARWESRFELMDYRLDRCEYVMDRIENRNETVYRKMFGLGDSGQPFEGVEENYLRFCEQNGPSEELKELFLRQGEMSRRLGALSLSLDEVSVYSRSAGSLYTAVPSIPPVLTGQEDVAFSSPFGYREDPFTGTYSFHSGQDISMPRGREVYATGNGIVESTLRNYYGYGNVVVINHGYGYRTLYAHLDEICVEPGCELKRGTLVGTAGSTGRSTGSHLHYEVHYQGIPQNPMNYADWSMSESDYREILNAI